MSRLKLDWSLNLVNDRRNFVDKYLSTIPFKPNTEELEMLANYILWGKDENGKSSVDNKEIEIETKNKTWSKKEIESLDALMESPAFNEASLQKIDRVQYKIQKETFSREDALRDCPDSLRPAFLDLFHQIDVLDICINLYELAHGKRKKPPRAELLKRFSDEEVETFKEKITHWNQFFYLKKRHLLVELRREQFTMRDSFVHTITQQATKEFIEVEEPAEFNAEIPVLPLGIIDNSIISNLLFRDKDKLNPSSYSEDELKKISNFLWEDKRDTAAAFDFCNPNHVYNLFLQLNELKEDEIGNNTKALISTLDYYIGLADLNEIQKEILDAKIKKIKNQDIAHQINKKYSKAYTDNYISTIFKQKIIPKICDTVALHFRIIQNLFFEEEFKKCTCCGVWLLRDPEIFVKKSRSKDGLANRCKKCDKLDRQRKKEV